MREINVKRKYTFIARAVVESDAKCVSCVPVAQSREHNYMGIVLILILYSGGVSIKDPGSEVIKLFSCLNQLSTKFQALIKT